MQVAFFDNIQSYREYPCKSASLENIPLLSLAGLFTAWLDVFKSYNLDITGS